jgi:pimeloyl-ACP methyl ester carboxylesterase
LASLPLLASLAAADMTQAASVAYRMALAPAGTPPVSLYVVEHGAGPPLVLLHGMAGSGYSFRHLVRPLGRAHRVITLDLKGFGASDKPLDSAYGVDDQARLVAAFLRQRRLTNVTLAGHSFGAAVALYTALRLERSDPGRLRRLVLMNVPAYPQPLPASQWLLTAPILPHIVLAVMPPILATRAALNSRHRSGPPATEVDAETYAEPLYDIGGRHALIATARAITEADSRAAIAAYPRLRLPTLLIWCRHDRTVPLSSGERLAATLPRARLDVFESCEHKPAEEAPVETVRSIEAFLRRS